MNRTDAPYRLHGSGVSHSTAEVRPATTAPTLVEPERGWRRPSPQPLDEVLAYTPRHRLKRDGFRIVFDD